MKLLKLNESEATKTYMILNSGPKGQGHNWATLEPIRTMLKQLEDGAKEFVRGVSINFDGVTICLSITTSEVDALREYYKNHTGWAAMNRHLLDDFIEKIKDLPDVEKPDKEKN